MRLHEQDWEDLGKLLFLAKHGRLTPPREQRLRYLVLMANPDAFKQDLGTVIRTGLLMVGHHMVREQIREREARASA
jgi:hypothetical protein